MSLTPCPCPRPELLSFAPRKGTLLLWTNVLNSDPDVGNPFARHEACTVRRGIKYGANIWIHQYPQRSSQV